MVAELIRLRDAQLSIEDGVAEFSHQHPAARNALSASLHADYVDMLAKGEADAGFLVLAPEARTIQRLLDQRGLNRISPARP